MVRGCSAIMDPVSCLLNAAALHISLLYCLLRYSEEYVCVIKQHSAQTNDVLLGLPDGLYVSGLMVHM